MLVKTRQLAIIYEECDHKGLAPLSSIRFGPRANSSLAVIVLYNFASDEFVRKMVAFCVRDADAGFLSTGRTDRQTQANRLRQRFCARSGSEYDCADRGYLPPGRRESARPNRSGDDSFTRWLRH